MEKVDKNNRHCHWVTEQTKKKDILWTDQAKTNLKKYLAVIGVSCTNCAF